MNTNLEEYLESITSGLDETNLTPREVAQYMWDNDKMPEDVYLWEPLEDESPQHLLKGFM